MTRRKRKGRYPWWLHTRKGYSDYLKTRAWLTFRSRYFEQHSRTCFVCGSGSHVQLHHLTYRRVGREEPEDVIPLCKTHHEQTHALIQAKKASLRNAHLRISKTERMQ